MSVSGDTYEILDGVRRAKAAQMAGLSSVSVQIDDGTGALSEPLEVPIKTLLSPKDAIDVTSTAKFRRFRDALDRARQGLPRAPLIVTRGVRGRLIADVEFDF